MQIGRMYKVRDNHPHHPGKCGLFAFMGGPDYDVVVLELLEQRTGHSRTYFAVGETDILHSLPIAEG